MTNETKVTKLPLSDIKADPACQARITTDATTIAYYAAIMTEEGDVFPPVVTYYDGTAYWLSDGFHRHAAAEKAGLGSLKAEIRQGTHRDAILYAVGANATLRRTKKDKRHAVGILLADEEWSKWSNRTIAHRCGVDEKLVRTLRSASAAKPQIARKFERNGTVSEMDIGRIGKTDGLEELLSIEPDQDEERPQQWLVAPESPAADRSATKPEGDERQPAPYPASSNEVHLHELMSAWDRASQEARQQFLAKIGVSLSSQAEPSPAPTEPKSTQEPEASENAELSATEPQENPLFDMWKNFKPNTQACGRRWIVDGCPSEYPGEHFVITDNLVPFRAAASAATEDKRQQFLELSRAA